MKKIIGIVCVVLAILFLVTGVSSGGSTLFAGIIVAAILVFIGVKLLKKAPGNSHQSPATASPKPSRIDPSKRKVIITETGTVYHDNSICPHIYGKVNKTKEITVAEAKKRGLKPCKNCYPYGD
jgi:hypothetical protein